jgi:hypothetical protein
MVTDEQQWYVQKGPRVQGPYSATEVGRFLLLGRVRNTDRVSRDGELWEPVTQVPELIPEELLDLDKDGGWERFMNARVAHDERQGKAVVPQERRTKVDAMPEHLRDDWAQASAPLEGSILPWSLLGLTLAILGVVLYLNTTGNISG